MYEIEKRGEREKKIIKRKKYFSQVRNLEFLRYARVHTFEVKIS